MSEEIRRVTEQKEIIPKIYKRKTQKGKIPYEDYEIYTVTPENQELDNIFDFPAEYFKNPEKQSKEDIERYNKYISDTYLALKESNLFTPEQIAGIMANIREETLLFFNPGTNYERVGSTIERYKDLYFYDAKTGEKIDLDLTSPGAAGRALASRGIPSEGGIGILQWTGPRKEEYVKWCNENNYEWDNTEHQVEYFIKEYTDPKWQSFRTAFEKTKTPEEATEVFCIKFEQPENAGYEAKRRARTSGRLMYEAITKYENQI